MNLKFQIVNIIKKETVCVFLCSLWYLKRGQVIEVSFF
jgi:hypothetical protein